jgi:hypothetical protein
VLAAGYSLPALQAEPQASLLHQLSIAGERRLEVRVAVEVLAISRVVGPSSHAFLPQGGEGSPVVFSVAKHPGAIHPVDGLGNVVFSSVAWRLLDLKARARARARTSRRPRRNSKEPKVDGSSPFECKTQRPQGITTNPWDRFLCQCAHPIHSATSTASAKSYIPEVLCAYTARNAD